MPVDGAPFVHDIEVFVIAGDGKDAVLGSQVAKGFDVVEALYDGAIRLVAGQTDEVGGERVGLCDDAFRSPATCRAAGMDVRNLDDAIAVKVGG